MKIVKSIIIFISGLVLSFYTSSLVAVILGVCAGLLIIGVFEEVL